jgi:hypothetical protein
MTSFPADWCNVLNTRHWLELLFTRTLVWNWRYSGVFTGNTRNIKNHIARAAIFSKSKFMQNVSYVNSEVLEAESMNTVVVRDATRFRRGLLLSSSGWNEGWHVSAILPVTHHCESSWSYFQRFSSRAYKQEPNTAVLIRATQGWEKGAQIKMSACKWI